MGTFDILDAISSDRAESDVRLSASKVPSSKSNSFHRSREGTCAKTVALVYFPRRFVMSDDDMPDDKTFHETTRWSRTPLPSRVYGDLRDTDTPRTPRRARDYVRDTDTPRTPRGARDYLRYDDTPRTPLLLRRRAFWNVDHAFADTS